MKRIKGALSFLLIGLVYAPLAGAAASPVIWLFMCAVDLIPMTWGGLGRVWSTLVAIVYAMCVLGAIGELWKPTETQPASSEPPAPASAAGSPAQESSLVGAVPPGPHHAP